MSEHTPGPWKVNLSTPADGFECYWITACPVSNQERELATVTGPHNANNGANAHLIAAAPDLLAALKQMVADYGDVPEPYDSDGQAVISAARAAVAKADGQS